MPEVATTRSPSHRPRERSSSAIGEGWSWNGPVIGSAKTSLMVRVKPDHSSAVTGRSCDSSAGTEGVYRAGPPRRHRVPRLAARSGVQVGQRGHDPPVLVLVLGQPELGEQVLGVLLHRA